MILDALVKHFVGPKAFPDSQLSQSELWVLVCLLFAIPVLGVLSGAHSFVIFTNISATVRNAIIPTIFKKALKLGNSAKQKFSSGYIMNLYGNDVTNIQLFLQAFAEPIFARKKYKIPYTFKCLLLL
jgi:ABC-type transport system involved in cytochrome bd biosynthesis fused ATPase/permease subunit